MIPLADDNPTRRKPYVVYVLLALNVLVYLVDRLGARGPFGNLWDWSMVPYALVHNSPVQMAFPVQMGNMVGQARIIYEGLQPMWLTVFSSMFMHASLTHIGGNMLYLWIFGNNIEDALGHARFLAFYLLCGVCAAGAHVFNNLASTTPTVGASGAIAGVLGAYLVLYPGARVRTMIWLGFFVDFVAIPAVLVLGVWFVSQLLNLGGSGGLRGGGVAYWAHVGGFVAGAVGILLLGGRRKLTRSRRAFMDEY